MTKKTLAIIPARAGSKRLPGKNVKPLQGEPMIAWTIRAAIDCKSIDKVIITTDDDEVSKVANSFNVQTIKRPADLASDSASSESVVKHVLNSVGETFDRLVVLQPTSPLRTAKHIAECLLQMDRERATSSISVTALHIHPSRNFKIESGKLVPFEGQDAFKSPISGLPLAYRPNGAIYAIDIAAFKSNSAFFVDPCAAYVMDQQSSVDVDTMIDFELCELILAQVSR